MSDGQDIDALRATMQEKADAECRQIEEEAKERVAEIRKRGEVDRERLRKEAMERLEREVRAAGDRKRVEVSLAGRLARLTVKHSVIDEVFVLASRELSDPATAASLPAPYESVLESLIREAAALLPAGGTITVSKSDGEVAKRLTGELDNSVTIQTEDAPRGTVIARSSDGLHTVDNGIAGRLRRGRSELMPLVSAHLFGKAEGGER